MDALGLANALWHLVPAKPKLWLPCNRNLSCQDANDLHLEFTPPGPAPDVTAVGRSGCMVSGHLMIEAATRCSKRTREVDKLAMGVVTEGLTLIQVNLRIDLVA